MFLTNERPNPYSELHNEDPKVKQKKKKETKEIEKAGDKRTPFAAKKSNLLYHAQFGFESQDGFDKKGYGLIFSAIKPLPKFFENYKNTFFQADFLYTIKDLETASGITANYLALTGYGGYAFNMNEKTVLTARMGSSFVTGNGKFEFSYALGITRTLKNKNFRLIANWIILGDLTILSLGAEF